MSKTKKIILWLISILILLGCYLLSHVVSQRKPVQVKPPQDSRPLVTVLHVKKSNYPSQVFAIAQVCPDQKLALISQVSGRITWVSSNFIEGGRVKKGETLAKVEDTDANLALQQAKASLSQQQANYKQALGKAEQAKKELEVYEKSTGSKIKNTYLALRKPQLEQAKANLKTAQLKYRQALINLKRTNIIAPFDAIVTKAQVTEGSLVGAGVSLGEIVNSQNYRLNVGVPVSYLKYLSMDKKTTAQVLDTQGNIIAEAKFLKVIDSLDDNSGTMGVLFKISDISRNYDSGSLFLGDFVRVKIKGKTVKNVYKVPLNSLKQDSTGNLLVYLVTEGKLRVVPVHIKYEDHDYAYVQGLQGAGDVVISDLSIAFDKMAVKIDSGLDQ